MSKKLKTKKLSHCPICQGPIKMLHRGVLDRLDTVSQTFSIDQCQDCTLVFTNPMPVGNIELLYPKNYLSADTSSSITRWYREDQYRFDFNLFSKATGISLNQVSSYLDVGCGSGERLFLAKKLGISHIVGIDRYDYLTTKLKKIVQNIEILDYHPKRKYSLISMFHVLEHVPEPTLHIQHIVDHQLEKEGYLLIQVPNFACWESKFFGKHWFCFDTPRHLWHLSPQVLTKWLESVGLSVIKTYQQNAPLHPVSLASSIIRDADPQGVWVKSPQNPLYWKAMFAVWGGLTMATIPLNLVSNLFDNSSMLTIIAQKTK